MKLEKSKIYGGIGSALVAVLLILLLFWQFTYLIEAVNKTSPELALTEIEEAFNGGGRGSEGKSGYFKPENAEVLKPQPSAPKTATTAAAPPAPNFAAQNIEQNFAVQRAQEEQRKKDEANRLRLQQEEQERQRIAAEQQAKTDKAKGAMSGLFGDGGKGNGSGVGTGTGNSGASGAGSGMTGNPLGKGSGGFGNGAGNWSLAGRDLKTSVKPAYDKNETGMVSVEIRVDAAGKVTSARVVNRPDAKTTIENENIRKEAVNAAYKTTFSAGNGVSIGIITYNFTLN
ncbi:MAG: energy transducer TonB [Prevotellaceae bacterium]|nr:energy transducer TonB [Prevotellaceae bacterium]